jgi:hypothetical protein
MTPAEQMIGILEEAKRLIALPENDFSWSSWRDAAEALGELDGYIAQLRAGMKPDTLQMSVVFTVTGPMQELSLSSGWGDAFIELADRFDAVLAKL